MRLEDITDAPSAAIIFTVLMNWNWAIGTAIWRDK